MNMNATLLGQAITFVLFVWFCMKFVWPPVINAIEKRQKEIKEGLNAAEEARKEVEDAQANTEELIAQAKLEASAIIDEANKRRNTIIEEAKEDALKEKARILAQARSEIEAERDQAAEHLRQKVAHLALAGAEKIIDRTIDEAANSDIIDKLVAKL